MAKHTKSKEDKSKITASQSEPTALLEKALENGTAEASTTKTRKRKHADTDDDEDEELSATETKVKVKKPKVKKEATKNEEDDDANIQTEIFEGQVFVKGLISPLAKPMATQKNKKKLLRGVHYAANSRHIKRGVKEVNKGIKTYGSEKELEIPNAVVILAGDISPEDVISHMPVCCEDGHLPYIFVDRRSDLGIAANTKRPTSVVMILRQLPSNVKDGAPKSDDGYKGKPKKHKDYDWDQIYRDVLRIIHKQTIHKA